MDNMLIAIYQRFVDEMHNTLWPTLFKYDGELFRFIVYNKYVTSIKLPKKKVTLHWPATLKHYDEAFIVVNGSIQTLLPFKLTELHLFAFFK